MFPIIEVNSDDAESMEQLGTKRKVWFRDGDRWTLFKAEERGTGEDWAEKVACELCTLLGLPHVHYEMAYDTARGSPGVVCERFTEPPGKDLAHGNSLLWKRDSLYPAQGNKHKTRDHTVDAVYDVVRSLEPPPAEWCDRLPEGITTAPDVFTGYLMLDAWIANQDRHHENWGAILEGGRRSLAPTFDHGSAMARNHEDDDRLRRLTDGGADRPLAGFAAKARSALYASPADAKPLATMAAWRAFAARTPAAAAIWLEQLQAIEASAVTGLLEQVPLERMSAVCRRFTLELLEENRRRLLDRQRGGEEP